MGGGSEWNSTAGLPEPAVDETTLRALPAPSRRSGAGDGRSGRLTVGLRGLITGGRNADRDVDQRPDARAG